MIKVNYPHVKVVRKRLANGTLKLYYYHQRTGSKIEGEPGTLEFQLSYEQASRRPRRLDVFAGVLEEFFSSKEFQKLGDRTRSDYLKHRNLIQEKWGNTPLDVLKDARVTKNFRRWRDAMASEIGDRQADYVFATARRIFSFAVRDGTLPHNPLLAIEGIYKADRSELIWLPEQVDAFMRIAPVEMQLAVILALNLGRREGDLLRLIWKDFKSDVIMVTNRKSGRLNRFPAMVTDALRNSLEAYRRSGSRIGPDTETILTTPTGKAWTDDHFRSKFSKCKNAAGLQELHFHDLRGTAITVLAEQGCTEQEIASISGHSLQHISAILDKYMARTRALNVEATKKLEQSWVANISLCSATNKKST